MNFSRIMSSAALIFAVAGCSSPETAAPAAAVEPVAETFEQSPLLNLDEASKLVGRQLTIRKELHRPNDSHIRSWPDYCKAVAGVGMPSVLGWGRDSYHEREFDENITEQSHRQHLANGLSVDEVAVVYPDAEAAAAAQRTVADAAQRCARQTVVIDYPGEQQIHWQFSLGDTGPTSTGWTIAQANSGWTCSAVSQAKSLTLAQAMVCWSSDTRESAKKAVARILDDRA